MEKPDESRKHIINQEKIEGEETFSSFVKTHRQNLKSEVGCEYMSTKELGEKLGIGYEQFRKIVNKQKPTKKRDCIIAICMALGLSPEDTDKGLVLYDYMPTLDSYNNSRDNELSEILAEHIGNPISIEEANKRLSNEVGEGSELDIIDHRSTKKTIQCKKPPYKILEKSLRSYNEDLLAGDQYDSLATAYNPNRYRVITDMWLDDTPGKQVYHLLFTKDIFGNTDFNFESYGNRQRESDVCKNRHFKNMKETGVYQYYFLELRQMANRELKRLLSVLTDTRNYKERVSANIFGDSLHVFAETINYVAPEIHEYYLFEYIGGRQQLSVYGKSEFMRCYLAPEVYSKIYVGRKNLLIAQYDSIEKLKECIRSEQDNTDVWLLENRLRIFAELKEKADALLCDLKAKRKYIYNLEYIYEDRDHVCRYYQVEKEFDCTVINDGDIIVANRESADFAIDESETINITLEDLYRAFELGFKDIQQICRIKKNLGSIEDVLQIDHISENRD